MIIYIRVKAGSSKSEILATDDPELFIVYTHNHPHDNAANDEIIALLSDYFKTAKSNIIIRHGLRSKLKQVDIF